MYIVSLLLNLFIIVSVDHVDGLKVALDAPMSEESMKINGLYCI